MRMRARTLTETAVYRLYDAEGRLLYIGMAGNPYERWLEHARTKPWWSNVASRSVDWYPTIKEARAVEKAAIATENSAYNVHGTPTHGRSLIKIPPPITREFGRLFGAHEIGERLGVGRQRVQQLINRADWPEPYDTLRMGKVWLREDVETWIREHRPDLVEPEDPGGG